jgi:hypothetical protein
MEGGELFQRIQDKQDGAFTERGLSLPLYVLISSTGYLTVSCQGSNSIIELNVFIWISIVILEHT